MLQIALIGLVTVLLAGIFQNGKKEYGTYLSMAGCLLIAFLGTALLREIMDGLRTVLSELEMDIDYFLLPVKLIGIAYLSEFTASICKDAGHTALALQVEFFGKLMILAVSIPVITTLLKLLTSLSAM